MGDAHDRPGQLPAAAALLAKHEARPGARSPQLKQALAEPVTTLAYHFDVHGYTVTVTVPLDPAENSVPTITPWFRNADWNEREFAELFDVHVDGNTNPKRLFLDPEIDEGILNEVIPLTIMMNGACTKDMWERIMEVNAEPGEEVEKGVHE